MTRDFSVLHHFDTVRDFNAAVGDLANKWSGLEQFLFAITFHLMEAPAPVARRVFHTFSAAQRSEFLIALLREPKWRKHRMRERIEKALKEYDRLRPLRNKAIHGIWQFPIVETEKQRALLDQWKRKGFDVTHERALIDLPNLRKISDDINAVVFEVGDIAIELQNDAKTPPK